MAQARVIVTPFINCVLKTKNGVTNNFLYYETEPMFKKLG